MISHTHTHTHMHTFHSAPMCALHTVQAARVQVLRLQEELDEAHAWGLRSSAAQVCTAVAVG